MSSIALGQRADAFATPLGRGDAVVAIDVGGTDIKAALFDSDGRMLGLSRTPTPHAGSRTADAIVDRVHELADELRRDYPEVEPRAVGIIAPGLVDDERGIGVYAANLNWRDVPFASLVHSRLAIPCSFSHDVRAAGEAEMRLGAGRGLRDTVVIVVGTGIAGAIFVDGRPQVMGGYAGEIGHSIIDPAGAECACGARGCLESIASAGAIVRRFENRSGRRVDGARQVVSLAQSGDATAAAVWSEAIDALALSISQLSAVLAPEAIVIGGGVAQAGEALFVPLRARIDGLLSINRRTRLLPAQLGENAGILGSALKARDLLATGPAR